MMFIFISFDDNGNKVRKQSHFRWLASRTQLAHQSHRIMAAQCLRLARKCATSTTGWLKRSTKSRRSFIILAIIGRLILTTIAAGQVRFFGIFQLHMQWLAIYMLKACSLSTGRQPTSMFVCSLPHKFHIKITKLLSRFGVFCANAAAVAKGLTEAKIHVVATTTNVRVGVFSSQQGSLPSHWR